MKDLVCIVCPMGCRLKVDIENDVVQGNKCPRGKNYGLKELVNPTRVITTTVKVNGGIHDRLPVKTAGEVPKGLIFDCMKEINKVNVTAPIKVGDVIINNILDTGVDIIASRDI